MGSGMFGASKATNTGNKQGDLFGLATFAREDNLNGNGRDCEAGYTGKDHFGRRGVLEGILLTPVKKS